MFNVSRSFAPEYDKLDMSFVERGIPVIRTLSKYFRPSFHGIEHIPRRGPALLVGNHGLAAFDGFVLFTEVYHRTGRLVRGLGEHFLFVPSWSRTFWTRLGAIDGTPENAVRFLKAGNLVNTYPGGARDALKGREGRYKLHWDKSKGYVRVAMQAQVPVIVHVGIGTDDTYRILGRVRFPARLIGNEKYEVPLLMGWGVLPRPVKFIYYISEPITLDGDPDDVDDEELVDRNHRRVWELGQRMLDEGVERRRSIWFG